MRQGGATTRCDVRLARIPTSIEVSLPAVANLYVERLRKKFVTPKTCMVAYPKRLGPKDPELHHYLVNMGEAPLTVHGVRPASQCA